MEVGQGEDGKLSVRMILVISSLLASLSVSASCSDGAIAPQPSAIATAPSLPTFVDEFDHLDTARWTTGVLHTLGRSEMKPRNVSADQGVLRLGMNAGQLDGAEIRTQGTVPRGVYRARLMAANAPGSVTGFFLYAPPDLAHEVDIELYNQPEGRVRLTT